MLHSNSPRQREKRTRLVAQELAQLRLAEVAAALRAGLRGYDSLRLELAPVRVHETAGEGESRVRIDLLRP